MPLPTSIERVVESEIRRNLENGWMQLINRKGDQGQAQNKLERNRHGYDVLPEGADKEELIKFWMDFHANFSFPDFTTFYSKKSFCLYFCKPYLDKTQSLFNDEDRFISLLADRKFLFIEDNEHGDDSDCPSLSEIVRAPDFYLKNEQCPGESDNSQAALAKIRENARTVREQGFIPTISYKSAYKEMRDNEEDIRAALEERKGFLRHSQSDDGIIQFPAFTIPISSSKKEPDVIDQELSQLFHDFVYAAAHRAYQMKQYGKLIDSAKDNSINAIVCVRQYLEENSDLPVPKALIFWWLFTKETTKLAKGELGKFTFKMQGTTTNRHLTRETQARTYRKIDCQIMLFDYLLELLPPSTEQETAYAKFQFHVFSKYNGYTHFRVKPIKYLECDPKNNCKFCFDLSPDSRDCVDRLGGVIRKHILRCVSNDVRWLTPGLQNDWSTNSSILATLLLQDIARFPKIRCLINRIYSFLRDEDKGKNCVQTYRDFEGGQRDLRKQLETWCKDNDLIFEDDIPSSDMEISADTMKLLCSRLVLEYMLKEQILLEVRECLSVVAQKLWGHLLLDGYETFNIE